MSCVNYLKIMSCSISKKAISSDLSLKINVYHVKPQTDVAKETLRRSCEKIDNPGGYLQAYCASLEKMVFALMPLSKSRRSGAECAGDINC